jgi:hypothetical protein
LTKTVRESKQKHTEFQFSLISVKVLNVTVVKRATCVAHRRQLYAFCSLLLKLKQIYNPIRTRVKYSETLEGNNFKIPRSNFFKFGTVLQNG